LAPTLGILATLRDWKGHDYLLDAWQTLCSRYPNWQLLIIGDGPRRAHLQQRVQQLQLGRTVHFVGNQDNVAQWLSCLDLFTLPSYGSEGVPQSIMQAMACGLAVVSTPVGAIAEAVLDGATGTLIAPRDTQALVQALSDLMHDDAKRNRFAVAALDYARTHFSLETMLDRMEAVFHATRRQGH
jgi:glycosyltransferase involved in cell wall biosynthesis